MKKILALLLICTLASPAFSQDGALAEENPGDSVGFKDVLISAGDVLLVNMIFNCSSRIVLDEEYSKTTLDTMAENFRSRWVWDDDGFFMNQFGHPYQGSLYFESGRSNGLNFWQSLAVAAGGSFLWEEVGETTRPSVNDIITTPVCGAVVGEAFHRLFIDANALCPALAWLVNPLAALNSAYRGRTLSVSGRTEEIDLIFHGGLESSTAYFSDIFGTDEFRRFGGGTEIRIQYGLPEAHSTAEPFDLFTMEADVMVTRGFYSAEVCIDGFLWSRGLFFDESSGTLGLNLMYDVKKSSAVAFSDAAVGVKYVGARTLFDGGLQKLAFSAQLDGIFMGTRTLYYLYEDSKIDFITSNPVRSYDFGYGALVKAGISLGGGRWGTLFAEGEASLAFPYPHSELDEAKAKRHLMAGFRTGYEHKIGSFFSLGIRDRLIFKTDFFDSEPNTRHVLNSAQVYAKVSFSRE